MCSIVGGEIVCKLEARAMLERGRRKWMQDPSGHGIRHGKRERDEMGLEEQLVKYQSKRRQTHCGERQIDRTAEQTNRIARPQGPNCVLLDTEEHFAQISF